MFKGVKQLRILPVLLLIYIGSCKQFKKEGNPWKLDKHTSLTKTNFVAHKHEKLFKGGQNRIDLFFNSNQYQLIDAYMYCNIDSICCLDSLTSKIIGCNDHLYMSGDTVQIYYTPNVDTLKKYGKVSFPAVTLLFKDKLKSNYYVCDTTISYTL